MRGGSDPPAAFAANERAAAEAWNLARSSGSARVPGDDVLDVVRSKIFRPDSRPNAPLREMWTETRGRFFPTKEELFRQQCVVTDSLKRSQRLMTAELERALDVLRRRDAHIANLERSLVQLSLEWYETGEENKRLAAAREAAVARRRAIVLANVRRALTARAWHKWRHETHARLRRASSAAVDDARAALRTLRDEKRDAERRAARAVEDRRARFLRHMRHLPAARAFRTWVAVVAAERRRALESAAAEAREDADVAQAALQTHRDEKRDAETRAAEAETAREDADRARRRLWGAVRGLGLVAFRRDERDARDDAFERWSSTTRVALVARVERVVAGVEATRKAKTFKTWRAKSRAKSRANARHVLNETRTTSETRTTAAPRRTPPPPPPPPTLGIRDAPRSPHLPSLPRAKPRSPSASRLAAEVATLRDALESERAARRDESRESSRRLAASAAETARWRVAAERGWALTQRRAHAALRRVTLRARFRLFRRWRDAARFGAETRASRAEAASRVSESESRVASLEAEVGALRLFRDAVASTDRSVVFRRGGGYVPVERYLAVVENRIAAAALEEALDADGDDAAKAKAARYGLKSALDALRGAVAGGGRAGEDVSRDGSETRWRPAARPAPKPRRGKPPAPSEKEKQERGVDGNEWTRLFGVPAEGAIASRANEGASRDAQSRARRRRRRRTRRRRRRRRKKRGKKRKKSRASPGGRGSTRGGGRRGRGRGDAATVTRVSRGEGDGRRACGSGLVRAESQGRRRRGRRR